MKALIIEDEMHAALVLKSMLSSQSDSIKTVEIAPTIAVARTKVKQLKPDVVFFDIMMNGTNIMSEARHFIPHSIPIIVTTGYDQFALTAIDAAVIAYLLKPIDSQELSEAMDKVLARQQEIPISSDQRILIRSLNSWHIIELANIVRIEASKGYTIIYQQNGEQVLVSKSIGEVNELLTENLGFLRIHKSHMINLAFVSEVKTGKHPAVILQDRTVAPLAQRRKDHFLALLKNYLSL